MSGADQSSSLKPVVEAGSRPTATVTIEAATVLDALADIVLVIDPLGTIRFANRAAEGVLGYRFVDHVGRSLLELIHPDDVANVVSSVATVQAKTVGTPIEVRVRAADGSWHWFEEIGANAVFADGSPAIVCAARSITQRRMWEVAGGDTERARQIIHVSPTISLLLDGDGIVLSANGAFTRVLGHDQSEVIGRPLVEFVAGDPAVAATLDQLRAGAARITFETQMTVVGQAVDVRPMRFEIVNHLADPVIAGLVASGYDITELQAARQELEQLARYDALTGLVGRGQLMRQLDRLLASATPLALLYIDVDRFKPVNDRWGHEAGDRLLRMIAGRITEHVKPGDIVARIGGDEFVVVSVGSHDPVEARRLGERIEAAVSDPYDLPHARVRIGACVGIAIGALHPTTETLMAAADRAMYRVKISRHTSATRRRTVVPRRGISRPALAARRARLEPGER